MDYPRTDRWRRPLIVPAAGGTAKSHTRVTTIAKTLDDMNGLLDWKAAMVAGGAAARPDIIAQIAARWPRTDQNKGEIKRFTEALEEAAAGSQGRNLGDALHEAIRAINLGKPCPSILAVELASDVKAYQALLEEAGITVDPQYVERTVVLPELEVAGSFDFLATKIADNLRRYFIADLKTGKLYPTSVAMQLALYSRAETIYDWDTETHTPMPEVNQRIGLVVHLPPGEASASLWVLDLEAGWEAVKVALWVRDWRKRRDLSRPANIG